MTGGIIRGAVWDIDGTLIDSMPIWNDLGARYLRHQGITPEKELGDILFSLTLEEGVACLKKRYFLRESEQDIREGLMGELAVFYREQVPLKKGVRGCLELLKNNGVAMILTTVGDARLGTAALKRLGVWKYFRGILTCEQLHTSKKEPLIYQEAARILGTAPKETIVFEDVYHGIHSAHEAGFIVAAVEDEASALDQKEIKEEADIYIKHFNEISGLEQMLH